jgi:hypothetical protein
MRSSKLGRINPIRECRLSLQIKFIALAAIALVAFCGVNLMAQICPQNANSVASNRCFPVTTNGIYTYSDQISLDGLTGAQISFFANNFTGGQKQTAADAATLRGYNSNFLILHYRLSEMLGYGVCDSNGNPTATNPVQIIDTSSGNWGIEWPWSDNTANPPTLTTPWPGGSPEESSWYAGVNAPIANDPTPGTQYTYSGSPWVYECSEQHYLMNIGDLSSTGWPAYYSGLVLQELQDNNDDGVFADSFSVPNQWGDWNPALPIIDSVFENTWSANMHNYTDYLMGNPIGSPKYSNPNAFNGNYLWIPNVGSWIVNRDITDYTNVDGVMIEDFAEYGNENFLAPSDWALQMSRAIMLTNLNKIMIYQNYPVPYHHAGYERLFDTASYLLVKGNYTYMNMNAAGPVQWWPEYNIPIGAPTQALPSTVGATSTTVSAISAFQMTSGSGNTYYQRTFQNGLVMVNPTANDTGLIGLGGTYYMAVNDPDPNEGVVPASGVPTGQITYQAVQYVDLPPCPTFNGVGGGNCSAILLNSAAGIGNLLAPTVTVTPSSLNVAPTASLSVTVTVSGTGIQPTGSVTLTSGSYNSGATALTNGSATINIPGGTLAFGPNTLWATYTPDSTSSPIYYGATGISAPVTVALYLTGPNGEFDWTWMGGSSTVPSAGVGQNGVYPAQPGPPASNAIYPGGRESPYMWADNGGNIWLFGGGGYDSAGNSGFLNDFWEFTPSTGMWTWVGGSNLAGGTEVDCGLGCFAATNIPEANEMGANWTDLSGNFWLFGGWGSKGTDMWEYSPTKNEWAIVGGSFTGTSGVYGTQGVANAANWPGYRGNPVSATDSNGNFWLFGGYGIDSVGNWGDMNDLWEFTPSTGVWTWVSGSNQNGGYQSPGSYGTQGVPDAGTPNVPPGRDSMSAWIDGNNNFWVFGGENANTNAVYNDLWEFTPSTGLWTWVSGSNATGATGVYGPLGVAAPTNVPGSRDNTESWTDSSGNLWLFGGNIGSTTFVNDLWEFTPSLNGGAGEWILMGGSSTPDLAGSYNTLGTATVGSTPGAREAGWSVTDFYGNLWLFGGLGYDSVGNQGDLNDLWEYKPPTVRTTPTVTATPAALSITTSQDLAVTIAVSGTSGTPGGTVILSGGGYTSTAATLVNGNATINIIAGALAVGSDALTVSYNPANTSVYTPASGTATVTVTAFVPQDFSIGGSEVTLAPGATSGNTSTITITPSGGFTGNVQFIATITNSPTGAVQLPTLSFTTNPVSISGTTAGTTTLTITTTAPISPTTISKGPGSWYTAGGATLACLLLFGIPARRRSWRTMLGILMLLLALAGGGISACSTNTFVTPETPGTTEGTYTITVIGTSGAITESGTVSLTVQ